MLKEGVKKRVNGSGYFRSRDNWWAKHSSPRERSSWRAAPFICIGCLFIASICSVTFVAIWYQPNMSWEPRDQEAYCALHFSDDPRKVLEGLDAYVEYLEEHTHLSGIASDIWCLKEIKPEVVAIVDSDESSFVKRERLISCRVSMEARHIACYGDSRPRLLALIRTLVYVGIFGMLALPVAFTVCLVESSTDKDAMHEYRGWGGLCK